MKKKFFQPEQLIAMMDYPPLHSPEAFFNYCERLKSSDHVEPVIVIPAKIFVDYLIKNKDHYQTYGKTLEQFLVNHPKAQHFMTGGKHLQQQRPFWAWA